MNSWYLNDASVSFRNTSKEYNQRQPNTSLVVSQMPVVSMFKETSFIKVYPSLLAKLYLIATFLPIFLLLRLSGIMTGKEGKIGSYISVHQILAAHFMCVFFFMGFHLSESINYFCIYLGLTF